MATIEKVGKRHRIRQFVDGKLRTVARCNTKAEALVIKARLDVEERARSSVVYGSQLPMAEVLARWRLDRIGEGNDPLHTELAEVRLRNLCDARTWAGTASITPLSVSDYRKDGGSPRTLSFLAGVLRWARDTLDQYVDPKVLPALRPGKAGRRPSPELLADDLVAGLERSARLMSASAGALVHCLSTYGWRPITAARLRVCDFDQVGGAITCQVKGGDEVRHLLLPETIEMLRARAAEAGPRAPLFLDPRTGTAWDLRGGISRWSRDHLKTKVYDLKRYAISSMLDRGIPPQHIASFTGHRTVAQVLKYARTNEVRQRAALALMGKKLESPRNLSQQHAGETP